MRIYFNFIAVIITLICISATPEMKKFLFLVLHWSGRFFIGRCLTGKPIRKKNQDKLKYMRLITVVKVVKFQNIHV